ncbi:MAG: cyclic lactone autoinducer peptide [Lachnospiraceae bacterium]
MKQNVEMAETKNAKNTLNVLSVIATIFAHSACVGRCYEPQVPSKLKK